MSISGKPGLYKLIKYGKNIVIVESLGDHKRVPAHSRDKIISLGDVAIYTTGDDVPLGQVFEAIYKKYEGKTVSPDTYKTNEALEKFFEGVLPDFDKDRVYFNDIKKVIMWYNILVNAGYTTFLEEEKKDEEVEKAEEKKEDEK